MHLSLRIIFTIKINVVGTIFPPVKLKRNARKMEWLKNRLKNITPNHYKDAYKRNLFKRYIDYCHFYYKKHKQVCIAILDLFPLK